MNTPLFWRPVKIRLYIAYMCDAYMHGFDECDADNTYERLFTETSSHPYNRMWGKIGTWYAQRDMGALSDDEIIEQYSTWRSVGFKSFDGTQCTGMDLMRAKQRWTDRNWTRYEQRRDGRRTVARVAVVPILACFGIFTPPA